MMPNNCVLCLFLFRKPDVLCNFIGAELKWYLITKQSFQPSSGLAVEMQDFVPAQL